MNATVSLSLIVKNEAVHMHNVLRNAVLYADEIIIIDTGSTDNTKEIAKQYTTNVYDFQWDDDFSAARNFGLRKCTKDFIIWLDADDIILDADAIKIKELFSKPTRADIYVLPYHDDYRSSRDSSIFQKIRIFRNHKNFFFTSPLHEYIDTTEDIASMHLAHADIPIYHRNIDPLQDSPQRNLKIALKAVRNKAYAGDMRMWWNLSAAYRGVNQNDLALATCYTAITKNDANMTSKQKSNLYLDLGVLLIEKKEYEEAVRYLKMAMHLFPGWREPVFIYAMMLFRLKKYKESLSFFLQCKEIEHPRYADIFNKELYTGNIVNRWLARTCLRLGKIDSAIFYYFN